MEINQIVVDSSVFVALYYQGDEHHQNALKLFEEFSSKTLIVHPYVIQETATVLSYKFGHSAAASFLADVGNAANILIPSADIKAESRNFINLRKKISFTDATLIALAHQMNASLATFDRQMLRFFKK